MSIRNIRWVVVAIATFVFFIFCWRYRETSFFREFFSMPVRAKPSQAAFVGRWKLEGASLPSVAARTGKKPAESFLDLGPDGRSSVVGMPIENPFFNPEFQLLSKSGTWEFELKQSWMLTIVIDRGGYSLNIQWDGDRPVALVYAIGDPDSDERWVWRKVP